MTVKIGDKEYKVYECLDEVMTIRATRIYQILEEILTDDVIERMKDSQLSEMAKVVKSVMQTHQKTYICANMIDCPDDMTEQYLRQELDKMPKKKTDEIICFFLKSFFPQIIAEQVGIVTGLMTLPKAYTGKRRINLLKRLLGK